MAAAATVPGPLAPLPRPRARRMPPYDPGPLPRLASLRVASPRPAVPASRKLDPKPEEAPPRPRRSSKRPRVQHTPRASDTSVEKGREDKCEARRASVDSSSSEGVVKRGWMAVKRIRRREE